MSLQWVHKDGRVGLCIWKEGILLSDMPVTCPFSMRTSPLCITLVGWRFSWERAVTPALSACDCPPLREFTECFPGGSEDKVSTCKAGDLGSIPGLGGSPGEGNGNPLQYPCLENLMDRGAWWAAVHGVSKSWARLSS